MAGASKLLTVAATGVPAPTYQWRKNGVNITGATLASYTALAGTVEGTNAYDVVITNATGSATSATATIATSVQVTVASAPAARNVVAGQAASYSVTPAGTGPFTYQWLKNGVAIAGATNSTYEIAAASTADVATYSVKVTGPVGTVTSVGATLSVIAPFTISAQPLGGLTSVNVSPGGSTTLSVTAVGVGPFTYQWRKNGMNIAGATLSSFVAWAGTIEGSASYDVVITGPVSSLASNAVRITTCIPVFISQQPVAVVRAVGQPAGFSVTASGTAPLTYQWMKNGVNIVGATGASYSIASTVTADAASYSVKVTGPVGGATSSSVALSLHVAPTVSTQPVNAYKALGQAATFSVVAAGTGPFTYQWSKDGNPIAGANAATYSVAVVGNADVGRYSVSVANAVGAVLSQEAELAIVSLPVILIQPTAVNAVVASAARSYRAKYFGFNNGPEGWSAVAWSGKDGDWPKSGWYWNDQINEGLTESNLEAGADGGSVISPLISLAGLTSPELRFWYATTRLPDFTIQASLDAITWTTVYSQNVSQGLGNAVADLSAFAGKNCYIKVISGPDGALLDEVEIWGTGLAKEIVELSVATQGDGLTYQWYKDGVAITGATSRGYVIADATVSTTAGSYTVKVSNAAGSVTSSAAKVGILPLVSTQPASTYKAVGQSASFSVSVSGVGPFTYQWQKDGVPIAGATASAYSIVSVGAASAGSYAVSVSNAVGSVLSQSASLQIVATPVISTQPSSQGYVAKIPQTYRVRYFGFGSGPDGWSVTTTEADFYQNLGQPGWYWNPYLDEIPANPLAANLEGGFGGVVSSPWISLVGVTNPELRFICMSSAGTLSVQTSSDGTNWVTVFTKTNDSAMASYAVNLTAYAGAGCYVRATTSANPICNVYLDEVEVWGYGTPSNSATFSVSASGGGLTYQWYKDGVAISGATAATYSVADVYATGAVGLYSVRVTNAAGTTASASATLAILPAITTQPVALSKAAGQAASFSVIATGTGPLTYQWFKNGAAISGATTSSYNIAAVGAQHAGTYSVTISNALGQAASQSVALAVVTMPVVVSQPQSFGYSWPASVPGAVASYTFTQGAEGWGPVGAGYPGWLWNDQSIESPSDPDASSLEGNGYVKSPLISLAGLTSASVDFEINAYGGNCTVDVSTNGTSWSTVYTYDGSSFANAGKKTVSLSAYDGQSVYLRFYMPSPGAALLDNVEVSGMSRAHNMSVGVSGAGCTYQWFRNGVSISGATSSSYRVPDVALAASAGSYTVKVTNAAGSVTSAAAVIPAFSKPTITSQPASQSVLGPTYSTSVVRNYTFSSGAEGWTYGSNYGNGSAYHWDWSAGAISDRLYGSTYSSYTDTYTQSPWISLLGVSSPVLSFTAYHDLYPDYLDVLEVQASSDGVYWATLKSIYGYGNGVYSVSLAGYQWSGCYLRYRLRSSPLYNAFGIIIYDTVVSGSVLGLGQSASFSVGLSNSGGCTFQWYKDNVAISGANSSTYYIANTYASDAGAYKVVVTNAIGSVTSSSVTLTVR